MRKEILASGGVFFFQQSKSSLQCICVQLAKRMDKSGPLLVGLCECLLQSQPKVGSTGKGDCRCCSYHPSHQICSSNRPRHQHSKISLNIDVAIAIRSNFRPDTTPRLFQLGENSYINKMSLSQ